MQLNRHHSVRRKRLVKTRAQLLSIRLKEIDLIHAQNLKFLDRIRQRARFQHKGLRL